MTLCACPAQQDAPNQTPQPSSLPVKQVHITVGKIEPGMTAEDISVEVTMDGAPITCRVELTGLSDEGYWDMAQDEKIGDPVFLRLNVFYSLPRGYDLENIHVTMDCDGEYDGTGSVGYDAAGNVEAWSHALYGGTQETQPTEVTTQPTEPETLPPEETTQSTEPETLPPEETTQPTEPEVHTHSWTEIPGLSFLDCSLDRVKNYQCSCGATKQETVPAPGHEWKPWNETPATCTDDGQKTTSCKHCSAGLIVDIPATGHTWSDWVMDTGRVHKRTCSVCGEEETANHNIPSGEVTCTDCGADIIN